MQLASILQINEKNYTSLKIDPTCIFLTMHFYENLQECFFVQNQILTINEKKTKILNNKFSRWPTAAILNF